MEHSSKWNTHIKKEHSSKWNPHIIKRITHQNGTLILKGSLGSIDEGVLDRASASSCEMELSSSAYHGLSRRALDPKCLPLKYFFQHKRLFFESRITPTVPIGLSTLSPRCSAVLPHPEPTIDFSDWSAVFPFKPRDFRFRSLPVTSLPVRVTSLPVPGTSKRGPLQTRSLHQNEVKCAM